MSNFKPIFPNTPEYTKAINTVKNLKETATSAQIQFSEVSIGANGRTLKHTVVELDEENSKIILLFTRMSIADMQTILNKLKQLTVQLAIPGSWAEAEPSPLIQKQYDYVLFNVPTIRAEDIRNYFVRELITLT